MIFIPGVYRLTARRRRLHSGIAESEQREKAGGETLWGGEEKGERPTMQPDSLSVDAIPGRLGPVRGKSIPFASLGSALLIAIPLPTSSSPFFDSPLFQTQIYFFWNIYLPFTLCIIPHANTSSSRLYLASPPHEGRYVSALGLSWTAPSLCAAIPSLTASSSSLTYTTYPPHISTPPSQLSTPRSHSLTLTPLPPPTPDPRQLKNSSTKNPLFAIATYRTRPLEQHVHVHRYLLVPS